MPTSVCATQTRRAERATKRSDGDGACASQHLGGEAEAVGGEDVHLARVVREPARALGGGRAVRRGVLHDRGQPGGHPSRGHEDEREPGRAAGQLAAGQREPREDVARQRHGDEDHVRRVHERERERGGSRGESRRPSRLPDEDEERGHQRRGEQVARRGRGQRERRVRAAASRRQACQRNGREQRRDAGPGRPQDRHARLVGDDERDGDEHARLVEERGTGVNSREPGDKSHEHVPERERVAGVEPAVHELVHGLEPEVVERLELADAGEVEEPVAVELAGDRPEGDAEQHPSGHDPERERRGSPQGLHDREGESHGADPGIEREGPPQRPLDREHHRRRRRQPGEAPGERREDGLLSERARHERAGDEEAERRGGQPDVEAGARLREHVGESQRGQREQLPGPAAG